MYRYIECTKCEGKTIRTGGTTRRSVKAIKHLPKVGEIDHVRGYVYKGRNNVYHVGVLVVGKLGTMRFGGFCWGYGGEGPRGLNELFSELGLIDLDATTKMLGVSPNWNKANEGEHWRITFLDHGGAKLTSRQVVVKQAA